MHGEGIFTWANGRRYEGHYEKGNKNGFGIIFENGKKYEGYWLINKKHGVGK